MKKLSMEELNRKSVAEFKKSDKIPIIAVLENVRSAYNVGSVFRTADAFLLEGIYICGYTAFPPHKEIKKTALGADETVHWKHFKNIALWLGRESNSGDPPFYFRTILIYSCPLAIESEAIRAKG